MDVKTFDRRTAARLSPGGFQQPLLAPRPSLSATRRDLSSLLLWPSVLAWVVFKFWLTFTRYFNADGYECMHMGWLLHQGKAQYVDFKSNHPPLTFEVLSLFNYLTTDPVAQFIMARVLTLISSLLIFYLVWRITRDVYDAPSARWAVILFSTSVVCAEYTSMVRVDIFMLPLWLGSVAVMLGRGDAAGWKRLFWAGLLGGLACWSNQKAALLGVPCAVFAFWGGGDGRWRWKDLLAAAAGVLLPTAFYLSRAWLDGSVHALIESNLGAGAEMAAVDTYAEAEIETSFAGMRRDPALFILAVAAVGCGLWRWRQSDRRQRFALLYAPWLFLTLFMTPCPLVYYLLCVLPMFAVIAGGLIGSVRPSIPRHRRQWMTVGLVALLIMAMPSYRFRRLTHASNDSQCRAMRLATKFVPSGETVFDGSGTIFTRPDAYGYHWIIWKREKWRMRQGQLPRIAPLLKEQECRLIISNKRIYGLPEPDRSEIWGHYVPLWGPICVPGYDSICAIGQHPVEFELWYDGYYEFDLPKLMIDGRLVESPVSLSAGAHQISLPSGHDRVTLRDTSYRDKIELPADAFTGKMVP